MIVEEPNYCCPNCFEGFDVEIEVFPDIPWVANALLEEYKPGASAGDAMMLEDAIRDALEKLGVSPGSLE